MEPVFQKNADAMHLVVKLSTGETITSNENASIVRAAEQDLTASWGDW